MEVPQLVREQLGEETVEATVSLGDEDVVCVTPTRTFVYRGEGLLSDESVSVYPHEVERFDVSQGRRKTKFVFEYVEATDSFTVPAKRAETVRKLLLGGILHVAGVTVDEESISDVFSFSELTLVVTSHRLVKHVGAPVWDEDFEEFPYADVTGLSFEEGSVATQVVLAVDGRPQRIKAPSEQTRVVERSLKQALFAYHDVDSLASLNAKVGLEDTASSDSDTGDNTGAASLSLDDGISPLVGGDEESETSTDPLAATGSAGEDSAQSHGSSDTSNDAASARAPEPEPEPEPKPEPGPENRVDVVDTGTGIESESSDQTAGPTDSRPRASAEWQSEESAVDPEEIEAMKRQLSTLTTAVKKQNQLLRDQQETIDHLIEELRQGR